MLRQAGRCAAALWEKVEKFSEVERAWGGHHSVRGCQALLLRLGRLLTACGDMSPQVLPRLLPAGLLHGGIRRRLERV